MPAFYTFLQIGLELITQFRQFPGNNVRRQHQFAYTRAVYGGFYAQSRKNFECKPRAKDHRIWYDSTRHFEIRQLAKSGTNLARRVAVRICKIICDLGVWEITREQHTAHEFADVPAGFNRVVPTRIEESLR